MHLNPERPQARASQPRWLPSRLSAPCPARPPGPLTLSASPARAPFPLPHLRAASTGPRRVPLLCLPASTWPDYIIGHAFAAPTPNPPCFGVPLPPPPDPSCRHLCKIWGRQQASGSVAWGGFESASGVTAVVGSRVWCVPHPGVGDTHGCPPQAFLLWQSLEMLPCRCCLLGDSLAPCCSWTTAATSL